MRAATLATALLAGCVSQPPALYKTSTSEQVVGELRGQTAIGIDGSTVRWRCTYGAQQREVAFEETAAYCPPYRALP
jgi:starvation-inducible outer membrane lipoprotein